jgi:hypothetical protein
MGPDRDGQLSGYESLVELARREFELVKAEAYDALPEIWAERKALVATLPATPPASARTALEEALGLQRAMAALLEARLGDAGVTMRRVAHGRVAVSGYTPPVRRIPLVDHAG